MILFQDRITAWHKEQVTSEEDGTTQEKRATAPFVNSISCQISYSGNDKGAPKGRERLPQEREIKIFVSLDEIQDGEMFKRGDYIEARRTDKSGNTVTSHKGTIGEPRIYTRGIAHAEISLEAEFNA